MKKHVTGILGLLALFILPPALASDVHTVFTSWASWFGRERTAKTESWIGPDREWRQTSAETKIIRKDLGVMWRMRRSGKTYHESPLRPDGSLAPADKRPGPRLPGPPDPKDGPSDLRFVGHFEEPVYDWEVRALGDEAVGGEPCKVFTLRGDADFAAIDIKIWISPGAKDRDLSVPDELLSPALGRSAVAAKAIMDLLADFPKGGLVRLEQTSNPSIGPEGRGRIELESYEEKDPPAGIYDIPEGYVKEEGKK